MEAQPMAWLEMQSLKWVDVTAIVFFLVGFIRCLTVALRVSCEAGQRLARDFDASGPWSPAPQLGPHPLVVEP